MYSLKTSSKLGRWLAYAALAVLAILGGDLAANAIDISQPSNSTIQGASICSGSPTTGDPLVYNGTDWCGGVPYADGLNFIESGGTHVKSLYLDNNGNINLYGAGGDVVIDTASVLEPSAQGVAWDRNSDLTQTKESRTPLTLYDALTSGTYTTLPGQYTPSVNMHIRSLEVTLRSTLTSCTTYPTYEITLVGSAQATDAVTLTAGNSHWITNSGALAVPAGDAVSIIAETAGVSCSPSANNATFVMEMTTD